MNLDKILSAIGYTESSSFSELCSGLGSDCPSKGNRDGWREVFSLINEAEKAGFITVDRVQGKIDNLILTSEGADRIREKLDSSRPLFGAL